MDLSLGPQTIQEMEYFQDISFCLYLEHKLLNNRII